MLGRLILLIAFIIIAAIIIQRLKNTPKSQLKSLYWKIGLGTTALVLVLLAATGRIHWIGAMIGAAIPLIRRSLPTLIRLFPLLQQQWRTRPKAAPSSNNQSQVQTAVLNMTLDHDTEQLAGEVISGPFTGKALDSLELPELQNLLDYCHQQDKDSVKLLLTYLSHRFGNSWQNTPPQEDGPLSEASALAILGLSKGASKEQIIQAHRRMMQKVHPDRGGSDYLAAQINQAKDLLMANRA